MNKIFLLILVFFFSFNLSFSQDLPDDSEPIERGVVLDVLEEKHDKDLEEIFLSEQIIQKLKVKILTGELEDKDVEIENHLTSNPAFDINIKKGDRILVEIDNPDEKNGINLTSKDNSPLMFIIIGFFALSMIVIGGYKGMKSLIILILSLLLVLFGLIPLVLLGFSPLLVTVLIASVIACLNMFILGGFNIKSLNASLGSIFSFLIIGVISYFVIKITSLNSINSQEGMILWEQFPNVNFKEILSIITILGSIGAINDVAVSVSSCIYEVKKSREDYGFKDLFYTGINVGKDIIGPMTNTIIFVYMASMMSFLFLTFSLPFIKFINFNSVITVILAAIIGGLGIIYCVPVTSLISAYLGCNLIKK